MDLDNLDKNIAFDDNDLVNNKVYIKYIKRNGKKCITTIEGLENDLDIKKITKSLKKIFFCNGSIKKDNNEEDVIQLSGDQRDNVKEFLVDQEIIKKEDIIIK